MHTSAHPDRREGAPPMPDWLITYQHITVPATAGRLEDTLRHLYRNGVDEFAVAAATLPPEMEHAPPDVPDTVPEEWT